MVEFWPSSFLQTVFAVTLGFNLLWFVVIIIQTGFALYGYRCRVTFPMNGQIWQYYKELAPPLSIVIPAFNEAKTIIETVNALLNANYPDFEIIIVNDGSTDEMLHLLKEKYNLIDSHRSFIYRLQHREIKAIYQSQRNPKIYLIDKLNGGKADAQNAGINFSKHELLSMVDADTIVAPDALLRLVQPFIDNPNTVGVGGTILVENGCDIHKGLSTRTASKIKLLSAFQALEYLRAFLISRVGVTQMKMPMLISGAFGLFSKKSLLEISGYTKGLAGEDLDLIMKLHHFKCASDAAYRIDFVPDAICWTEVPENLSDLSKQRRRWHLGALESLFRYRHLMLAPKYGRVGFMGLPAMLLVDLILPIFTGLSYILIPFAIYLGAISAPGLLAFTLLFVSQGVLLSIMAVAVGQGQLGFFKRYNLIFFFIVISVLELFGYRQMNNIWHLIAIWDFIRGKKAWGTKTRKAAIGEQLIDNGQMTKN